MKAPVSRLYRKVLIVWLTDMLGGFSYGFINSAVTILKSFATIALHLFTGDSRYALAKHNRTHAVGAVPLMRAFRYVHLPLEFYRSQNTSGFVAPRAFRFLLPSTSLTPPSTLRSSAPPGWLNSPERAAIFLLLFRSLLLNSPHCIFSVSLSRLPLLLNRRFGPSSLWAQYICCCQLRVYKIFHVTNSDEIQYYVPSFESVRLFSTGIFKKLLYKNSVENEIFRFYYTIVSIAPGMIHLAQGYLIRKANARV